MKVMLWGFLTEKLAFSCIIIKIVVDLVNPIEYLV